MLFSAYGAFGSGMEDKTIAYLLDLCYNKFFSTTWYRRPDLNRHERKAHKILSLARLPIPPLRRQIVPTHYRS